MIGKVVVKPNTGNPPAPPLPMLITETTAKSKNTKEVNGENIKEIMTIKKLEESLELHFDSGSKKKKPKEIEYLTINISKTRTVGLRQVVRAK